MKTKKKKKEEIEKETSYDEDMTKARELLFYRKEEVIKYLNRKVPYVIFPSKYMKIEDISFAITKSGKLFIHFYIKDGGIKLVTLKENEPLIYTLEGLIMDKYMETFIEKTKDVLKGYLELLESIKDKYPNENIYFGLVSYEFIENIIIPENMFSKKLF